MCLKKRVVLAGLFAAAFAFGLVSTRSAQASLNVTCNVSLVAWAPVGTGEVQVNCGGTWYYGDVSTSSCTGYGIDAVKAWESLAQASLLSGKKLYIQYDAGSCINYARLTNQ
jgi:hypothetical protein